MCRILALAVFCLGCGTTTGDPPALSNQREILTSGYSRPVPSPDGRILALVDCENGEPCDVRIWDRLADKDLARMKCDPGGCRFSADGRHFLAVHPDGEIRRYSTKSWEVEARSKIEAMLWEEASVLLASSPDGWQVAFRTRGTGVVVWDINKHRQVASFADGRQEGQLPEGPDKEHALRAAFSPDGKLLAVVTGITGRRDEDDGPGELHVWDLTMGKRLFRVQVKGLLLAVAFSPDGKRIATGGTYGSEIWVVAEKKLVASLRHDSQLGSVNGVWFSPKGNLLITGEHYGRVTVWDAATGKVHTTLQTGLPSEPSWVSVSANTNLLLIQQERTIYLWDLNIP